MKRLKSLYILLNHAVLVIFLSSISISAQCRDSVSFIDQPTRTTMIRQLRLKNQCLMNLRKKLGEIPVFHDTEKPNAVVILPTFDPQEIYYSFSTIHFIKKLYETYDTKVVIAANGLDVFEVLEMIPSIELLFVGGAYLGVVEPAKKKIMLSYKGDLSYYDKRFLCYLDNLPQFATIVVYTCFAGTGGKGYDNIANHLEKSTAGKRIIAPRNNLSTCSIEINTIYPLDIQMVKNGKDMAYRVNF